VLPLLWWVGVHQGGALDRGDPVEMAWLVFAGPMTVVPLLLFAASARRLPLATVGLLQYLGPTIQLLIGVGLFGEPFGHWRLIGFLLIWASLALYSADGLRRARRALRGTTHAG